MDRAGANDDNLSLIFATNDACDGLAGIGYDVVGLIAHGNLRTQGGRAFQGNDFGHMEIVDLTHGDILRN